jgi:hypothetical protein
MPDFRDFSFAALGHHRCNLEDWQKPVLGLHDFMPRLLKKSCPRKPEKNNKIKYLSVGLYFKRCAPEHHAAILTLPFAALAGAIRSSMSCPKSISADLQSRSLDPDSILTLNGFEAF